MLDPMHLPEVAWIPEKHLVRPIRGLALVFHGLGSVDLRTDPTTDELEWLRAGALVVYPYAGPWSWMNRQARAFVDDLVDAAYRQYNLPDSIPLIATGGSMGGLSALLYTRYARRPVTACLALYPCCDLAYHFTERPDLPRTIRYAFRGYAEPWDQVLAEHSPLAQVPHMPDIPYLVIHGDADAAVAKAHHSDPFVAAMRRLGRRVDYLQVPGMGHGPCMPLYVWQRRIDFVKSHLAP